MEQRMFPFLLAVLALVPGTQAASVPAAFHPILLAHGILATLAWALIAPLGTIFVRVYIARRNSIWIHAAIMVLVMIMFLAAVALGIYCAYYTNYWSDKHVIIGFVVLGASLLQPITGLLHHRLFKLRGKPNTWTFPHIWWGKAVITLAIIDGGFGLQLGNRYYSGRNQSLINGEIAYGVIAGAIWLAWMIIDVVVWYRRRGRTTVSSNENMLDGHNSSTDGLKEARASEAVEKAPRPSSATMV